MEHLLVKVDAKLYSFPRNLSIVISTQFFSVIEPCSSLEIIGRRLTACDYIVKRCWSSVWCL